MRYIKRTHRQKDFNTVKAGEPPIRLTRQVGKVTYMLYLVVEDEQAHAALYKPALEKFYKRWNLRGENAMWKCEKCGRESENANQGHFCSKATNIDEYIAAQSPEVQPLLRKIRETIRAAAPDAVEKISWQMPTFWQGENLIHFADFIKHISIFPGGEVTAPMI